MSVIALAGGGIVLHSPTRIDPELRAEICRLGPVVAIIAPSWWHDLYLKESLAAFPSARLYVAQTLAKWRPSLRSMHVLNAATPAIWQDDLEQERIEGIGLFLDETVFCHRASRSLLVADLLFNFGENDAWLTRVLASVVIGPCPGCRFARMYRPFILNRRLFRKSIERVLRWDFQQIVVGHGVVVSDDGKRAFQAAFRWLLE